MLRHLPLITCRIEFTPLAHTPRPSITACREFTIAREHSPSPPLIDPGSPSLSDTSDASDGSMHSDDDNPSGSIVGDDDGVDDEDVKIIPKPPGEPGRPKSGGYNLEQALGWPDAIYQQVIVCPSCWGFSPKLTCFSQKHVHHEAHQRLETRKSFKNQSIEEIQAICDAVSLHWLSSTVDS